MLTKSMTTAKLPKSIHQKMLEKIIGDGYGMRGKSKWIGEAIEMLLALSNYPELVDIANEVDELPDIVSMRVNNELLKKIDNAVIEVRKQYPAMEGVKSRIIRASIFQRLIRS